MTVIERDERRWLLGRQTSGLNVVMAPDDRFNGVNPKETVWVVPEARLTAAREALEGLACPDPLTTRTEMRDRARETLRTLFGDPLPTGGR